MVEKEGRYEYDEEFMDLEVFFDMFNLFVDMVGVMMVSFFRMSFSYNDDDLLEDEFGGGSSLWSYY